MPSIILCPEVAGCFARACSTIAATNSFADKNALFKSIIDIKNTDHSAVADEVIHHFARRNFSITENRLSQMENRPKKGRNVGECMDNCISEFMETGNQIRMGLVSCGTSPAAALAVVHFFNVDRHGVFYDSEDHFGSVGPKPMTLLKFSHNDVVQILAGRQKAFLKEAKDWMAIWDEMNKKTYILSRTFGERGAFNFVKTLETTHAADTVVIGF
jgi:hypothetical protein